MRKRLFLLVLAALVSTLFVGSVCGEYIADGVGLTALTDDGKSTAVAWAYHGELVSFVRDISNSQGQLMIMKSDGTEVEAVTPIGSPFFAEWSWAGDKLSYEFSNADEDESQGGVYIYDVATGRSISISAPYPREAIEPKDGAFFSADDRYVSYRLEPGPSEKAQTWVADVASGKNWRILADRGESKEKRWSPSVPPRMCLESRAGGGQYDIAVVNPDGRELVLLTDIGPQSIDNAEPRWSPTGEWIAYVSDVDMTQTERDLNLEDAWIVRPDGSEARNLTKATSAATEEQLDIDEPFWSWDGRWIMFEGERFDNQGNEIPTLYMVDPVNGGYWPIITSYPREKGEINDFEGAKWSYDSTKIVIISERSTIKNWGPDPETERDRWVLTIYDVQTKKSEDIVIFDEQLDRKRFIGEMDRDDIENVSWSPDNRSILLTIATIVSEEDDVRYPDVYRVDLPERLIDASAFKHIGPPIGRKAVSSVNGITEVQLPDGKDNVAEALGAKTGFVTELVKPLNMTIEEAESSLSAGYGQYLTKNTARNLLMFKGPRDVLRALRSDLRLIDTPAPHILVDLLAVELSDEANRKLGLDWTYTDGHFGFFQPSGNPIQRFPHVGTGEDYRAGFPSGALDSLATLPGVGQSFYQGVGRLPREFFIRLNTLVSDGDGTILANPRTVAMSGKESMIQIRKTLNYFFNEGFDVSGRPIVKKSDISADTEGRIVPTLLDNGKIHLVIDVKVGSFTFTKDAGLPELTTRQSTTEVTVEQGQTLILGGLRQQEVSSVVTKVPILGDLPLLGPLFRHEETDIKHTVLTIFITPQILNEDNPLPEWPSLDPENYRMVPIMDDEKVLSGNGHNGYNDDEE